MHNFRQYRDRRDLDRENSTPLTKTTSSLGSHITADYRYSPPSITGYRPLASPHQFKTTPGLYLVLGLLMSLASMEGGKGNSLRAVEHPNGRYASGVPKILSIFFHLFRVSDREGQETGMSLTCGVWHPERRPNHIWVVSSRTAVGIGWGRHYVYLLA